MTLRAFRIGRNEYGPSFVEETDWQRDAACRSSDPNLFFGIDSDTPEPPEWRRKREEKAKAICAGCEVRLECLAAADGRFGIWGGLTPRERRGR